MRLNAQFLLAIADLPLLMKAEPPDDRLNRGVER